jgi:hypothetical protein
LQQNHPLSPIFIEGLRMKKLLAIVGLLALGFWLGSCGSSRTLAITPTTSASGNWEATLVGGIGEASKLDFLTTFSVGTGGGTLAITAFSFINTDPASCFLGVQGASGSTILTTNTTNQVTGSMIITVNSNPAGSTLTLSTTASGGLPGGQVTGTSNNGTLSSGVVTGNWTLTGGTGCTGQGTFLMCQGTVPCTPTIT